MERAQQQKSHRQLLTAIRSQDLKEVIRLIKDIDINEAIHDSRTCLHWASMYDNIEMVKALIAEGADVNVVDQNGMTPLHWVKILVNTEIMKALIAEGADVNMVSKRGSVLLHQAASEQRSIDAVQVLIEAKADVNLPNQDGMTPLHFASMCGNIEGVKALIAAGAKVNVTNRHGRTPLDWAVQNYNIDIVQFLIAAGADVNIKIQDGNTPLHIALVADDIEGVKVLMAAGAKVDVKDKDGMTSLELAIERVNRVISTAPSKLDLIKDRIESSKILIQYIVQSDFYEIKPDCVSNNTELSQFWDECRSEIEKMQSSICESSTISCYKLLRETDENKLAGYLSNKDIGVQEELEKAQYVKSFPIYASMIENQLSEGKKRLCLLHEGHIAMNHYDLTDLPEEIKSKIAILLTNTDLENLIESSISAPGEKLVYPDVKKIHRVGQVHN